jgi:membrane protease YdiL (CAAX protease family)
MDDPAQLAQSPALNLAALLLIGACGFVWLLAVQRVRRGRPLLSYQARRQVPWRGRQVLLAFVVLESPLLSGLLISLFWAPATPSRSLVQAGEQVDVEHPIVDLLTADSSLTTWLLCGLVAVVVAPIVEEFMYRLVLQGWLEAEERRARRRIPALRRLFPGVAPIVLVSLLFALRHFRLAAPPMEADDLVKVMIFQAVWSLLAFGFVLGILRIGSGATAADLGFVPRKLLTDVGLGLLVFAAVAAPIIYLQDFITEFVLPSHVAADPVPLFFLALALGTAYYRTHRIVPAIVIHMALNATSLGLAWLYFQAGAAG